MTPDIQRSGQPGGPGCKLAILDIRYADARGQSIEGKLIDAGKEASEVQMLRTIAHRLGINWGQDDMGWWAIVPETLLQAPAPAAGKD
jgi:hypothetical protein